jgi:hypothetical protein
LPQDDDVLRSGRPAGALSEIAPPSLAAGSVGASVSAAGPADAVASEHAVAAGRIARVGDRYRRGGRLGQGGMGVVDAGYDVALARVVALKRAVDRRDEERLLREARLTAGLRHPAIVTLLDLAREDDGTLVAVLEVRRGEGFLAALARAHETQRHPGPNPRLLRALLTACEAVGHAHRAGIVHRDLSPNNVVVDTDGAISVLDWGLAATLEDAALRPQRVGTPGWMAPEVEAGGAASPRSDVWTLGTLLQPVAAAKGRTPVALQAIVACATQTDPAARYADAHALADDLRRFLDGERVLAHREGPGGRVARLARRHPRAVAMATLGAVGGGLVVVVAAALVGAERGRADVARATALVEAAEGALGLPPLADALAARTLANSALALLDDAAGQRGPGRVTARARGVLAATARLTPVAQPAPPVAFDDATLAGLPLDGGARFARRSPDGARRAAWATMKVLLEHADGAARVVAPCAPAAGLLDVLPRDDGGAFALCLPGELRSIDVDGAVRPVPIGDLCAARDLMSIASPRTGLLAFGTTRGQVVLVDLDPAWTRGAVRGVLAVDDGPLRLREGPRPGLLLAQPTAAGRRTGTLLDVDSGAAFVVPHDAQGVAAAGRGGVALLVGLHGRSALVDDPRGWLWVGDGGGSVVAVDVRTGERRAGVAGPHRVIKSVAVRPRGDVVAIAAAGFDGHGLHHVSASAPLARAWPHDPTMAMRHVAFLDDETALSWNWSGGPFVTRLGEGSDGRAVATASRGPTATADVRAVATGTDAVWTLHVDGRVERLARGDDGIAHHHIATVTGGSAIAAAGSHVVVATSGGVTHVDGGGIDIVFDAGTDAADGPATEPPEADAVAVDPAGRVAVGLRSGRVLLFDDAGGLLLDVAAHTARASVVTFCDGGEAVCSAGWDGRVRVIALRPDDAAPAPDR